MEEKRANKVSQYYVYFKGLPRYMKIEILIASFLTLTILAALPVYAWFTDRRQLKDMKEVNAPTGLFISAAQKEDIKYLNLSGIDLKQEDTSGHRITSSYYVFCVYGASARAYNLQLAYTTNNPFEYKIYPAIACNDNDADKKVDYRAHDSNGNLTDTVYHYKIDGNQISDGNSITRRVRESMNSETTTVYNQTISTAFLNKNSASDRTANSSKHSLAYGSYSDVQQYAEPVYWQAYGIRSSLPATAGADDEFVDYYILEVNWNTAYQNAVAAGTDLTNDRETDIIYIIAESTSWTDPNS